MRIFLDELVHVSEHTSRATGVIIISGAGGIGKTKLLRAMKAKAAMMNFRLAGSAIWQASLIILILELCLVLVD